MTGAYPPLYLLPVHVGLCPYLRPSVCEWKVMLCTCAALVGSPWWIPEPQVRKGACSVAPWLGAGPGHPGLGRQPGNTVLGYESGFQFRLPLHTGVIFLQAGGVAIIARC